MWDDVVLYFQAAFYNPFASLCTHSFPVNGIVVPLKTVLVDWGEDVKTVYFTSIAPLVT